MSRRLMITGAAGFIGSRLLEIASRKGNFSSIVAVDCLIQGNYSSHEKQKRWNQLISEHPNVCFLQIDLRDERQLSRIPEVDFVIHQAGVAGLNLSWEDLNLYLTNNVLATRNIAEWAKRNGVLRFVHASTSSVYGDVAIGDESTCPAPSSPYGITKLASEQLLAISCRNSSLRYSILRYFSVYGPNQRPDMAYAKFIDAILRNKEIAVTGDLGKARSNTYIDDIALSTLGILERHDVIENDIYNVAGRESIKLSYAIETIARILGKEPTIRFNPHREGDQTQTHGDTQKIRKLGLLDQCMPFEIGIKKQIESYLNKFNSD